MNIHRLVICHSYRLTFVTSESAAQRLAVHCWVPFAFLYAACRMQMGRVQHADTCICTVWNFEQLTVIQILTVTVMKYHASVDWQELFSQGIIFEIPKCAALRENIVPRENITILAPPTRNISSIPVNICYIRWSKWMISPKLDGAFCFMITTKFGNKTRSLRTKQTVRKLDSFARFLLWRSIVNYCALWLRGASLSSSVS